MGGINVQETQAMARGYVFKKKLISKTENRKRTAIFVKTDQFQKPTTMTAAYFVKIVNGIHSLLTICKEAASQMLDWVQNTPLNCM